MELRRFSRHRLTRAALAVLTLVPLLYGALYLAAFWDPYGSLKHIPVALVQEDEGQIGKELAAKLVDRQVFGWVPTNAGEAERGLADGRYHLILRIPQDFSQHLTSAPDPKVKARQGALLVESDDATNYLSGLLARSAFTEIRSAASASAAGKYFDRMLLGFTDLKTQTAQAAESAAQLADGAVQAHNGADQLADGTGTLAGGLTQAQQGAGSLATGLDTLDAGAAQLADGAAKAAAGGQQLAAMVDSATGKAEPLLREYAGEIEAAATLIADGADLLADHLGELHALADAAVAQTQAVLAQLPPDSPAREAALQAATTATSLRAKLSNLDNIETRLRQVATTARAVAKTAPHLADDVTSARKKVDELANGLTALKNGAAQLTEGTAKAKDGAHDLSNGLYRLSSGARQLDAGASALSTGLATLDSGAVQLAQGLADGAGKIPGYDADDRAARSGVLGDPVALSRRDTKHAAATYGVGFAPYFLALALWVGAMLSYMMMRPLIRRHVVSGAKPHRVAFAGYLPAAAIGVAQAVVLFAVVRFGLNLHPVSSWGMLAFLILTALSFTAIIQFLGALLGPAGRLAALVLLMLQLTSSGGTYPVQTSPAFFQALHPFLPMTYVIEALRRLTVGGSPDRVWAAVLTLAAVGAMAFAATALVARRSRRLRLRDLHPVLSM